LSAKEKRFSNIEERIKLHLHFTKMWDETKKRETTILKWETKFPSCTIV